jgi:1-acyl-sn-glycerol-3-phosphate acyltransferase
MLGFLPAPLLGVIVFTLIVLNTMVEASLIMLAMPLRLLAPGQELQNHITRFMMSCADNWCRVNNRAIFSLMPRIHWDIDCPADLNRQGWYMITANHQSWVDILVMFYTFTDRIPFLKYFLKHELMWLPFMGQAMYCMDFPFMKRYSREFLERHPELKGKDMETTRKACEKFRHTPVSVINFLEGTRLTPAKQAAQASPYRHLLKPKAGGLAFVLSALGNQMHSLLDATIIYPDGTPTMWEFVCGKVRHIIIKVQPREIPAECFTRDYETDPAFRESFQAWTGNLWDEKDALLDQHLNGKSA